MSVFHLIEVLSEEVTFSLLGLAPGTVLAEAVRFFIYDTIKIFILLFAIIFVASVIRSYFPPEKIRDLLSQKKTYLGNILAAFLGIITPFCSCSAVPLFLGFIEAGVPLGVTFSFLVASPMINEVALALLFGMFGWKIACIYVVSGLFIAIFSGIIIGKLRVQDLVEDLGALRSVKIPAREPRFKERIVYARDYAMGIIKKVWPYVLTGVGLGAFIHGAVPADLLAQYAGADRWYAVPLAVAIGIPLYSNAAGVIPIVGALFEKGVALGTVLAFMMAVTALSLPEFLILRRIMKVRLIMVFASIVAVGIIFTGYLFNAITR